MNRVLLLICLASISFAAGCAGTRSMIVLMPDADGHAGTIHVETTKGFVTMDTAYTAVSTTRRRNVLPPEIMDKQTIGSNFSAVMAIEPQQRFRLEKTILYFPHDSAEPSYISINVLHETIRDLLISPPLELYVVGHADRVGEGLYNLLLSRQRAVSIEKKLLSAGIDPAIITTCFLGDTKPLVDAPKNVSEPRNRRVELIMKYPKKD